MRCLAICCLACAALALAPAAGLALAGDPLPPSRTVVPPRPDPALPNDGVAWEPAPLAAPVAAPLAGAAPASAAAAGGEGPAASMRLVVTVGGEETVIELPADAVDRVARALAAAVPTPAAPPPGPVALTPAPPAAALAGGGRPAAIIPASYVPHAGGVYRVQVGAFARTALALRCFERLRSAGFDPRFERLEGVYRVVIPGVPAADMPAVAQRLGDAGFPEAWIRREN